MAKKSKTQRAKASAARQARKAERERLEATDSTEAASEQLKAADAEESKEKPGKGIFKRQDKTDSAKETSAEVSKSKKKSDSPDSKLKKKRFQFFHDVRAELKRVTWPTRIDVLRWSGVVTCALLFFGIFTAVLDNFVVTPLLFLISGADPSSIDWFSSFTITDTSSADASSAADASSVDAGDSEAGE